MTFFSSLKGSPQAAPIAHARGMGMRISPGEKGTSVYRDRMPADGTSTARWSNRTSALPIERADRERLDDLLKGFNVSNWRIADHRAAAGAWLRSQSVSCVGSTLSRSEERRVGKGGR